MSKRKRWVMLLVLCLLLAAMIMVAGKETKEAEPPMRGDEPCPQGFELRCGGKLCVATRGWEGVTPSHPARVVEETPVGGGSSFFRLDLGVEEAPGDWVCDGDTVWVSPTESWFYNRDFGFDILEATWDGPEAVPCSETVGSILASRCE